MVIFSSLLITGAGVGMVGGTVGGTGVLTDTNLPDVSKVMVEAIGGVAASVGSLPSGLRLSIRV
ncbi:hypothetical protein D9M71_750920 [compost metagenome]